MIARSSPRRGFTLIELLVVIGIIVILASMTAAFLPNLDRNKGVPNAAAQTAGWINLSRAEALRDHRPHGLRFIDDGNGRCTTLQYIEQPEPIAPRGTGVFVILSTQPNQLTTATLFGLVGGTPQQVNWDEGIFAGDYLELTGGPTGIAQILLVGPGPMPSPPRSTLTLDRVIEGVEPTLLPLPGTAKTLPPITTGFRVIRSPRPLAGEPMLQLNKDVYIDLVNCFPCPLNLGPVTNPATGAPYGSTYTNFVAGGWGPLNSGLPLNSPLGVNNIDLLFNSSGVVASCPTGQLILAIRHNDRPTDILLISIYGRTGKTTVNSALDIPGQDPYGFTRDGKTPGL